MTPERIRELWDRNPDCMRFAQAVAREARREALEEAIYACEREHEAIGCSYSAVAVLRALAGDKPTSPP